MAYTAPWLRSCDCRCPVHHGRPRTAYTMHGCACTITCATQPLTLLADPWGCALFLDHGGDLWHVRAAPNGTWDWEHASEIDDRHDFHDAARIIARLLRQAAAALHAAI